MIVLDPAGSINLLSCGSYVMGTRAGTTGGFTSFFSTDQSYSEKGFQTMPPASHYQMGADSDSDDDEKDNSFPGDPYDY